MEKVMENHGIFCNLKSKNSVVLSYIKMESKCIIRVTNYLIFFFFRLNTCLLMSLKNFMKRYGRMYHDVSILNLQSHETQYLL